MFKGLGPRGSMKHWGNSAGSYVPVEHMCLCAYVPMSKEGREPLRQGGTGHEGLAGNVWECKLYWEG